jgi:hypothetical protein
MPKSATERPGVREQHLLRKRNNPLFREAAREVSNEALVTARLQDGLDMDRFMPEFQQLVHRTVALEPNSPSDTILEIKEQLDHAYQRACALPGDQSHIKEAVRKLVGVIMQAVRAGIGNDAYAARQLEEEQLARAAHYELQELSLVSALTHAESPVSHDELLPSLLSETDRNLQRCLILFDYNQLAALCSDGESYLRAIDPGRSLSDAWRRLELICASYRQLDPDSLAN